MNHKAYHWHRVGWRYDFVLLPLPCRYSHMSSAHLYPYLVGIPVWAQHTHTLTLQVFLYELSIPVPLPCRYSCMSSAHPYPYLAGIPVWVQHTCTLTLQVFLWAQHTCTLTLQVFLYELGGDVVRVVWRRVVRDDLLTQLWRDVLQHKRYVTHRFNFVWRK